MLTHQNNVFETCQSDELADSDVFDLLASSGKPRSFPKNTVVLNEGDPSNYLCLINSGRLKVYLSDDNGHEIVLDFIGAGEYFGEMALIDDCGRSASVMTMEDSKLTFVTKDAFNECLARHPRIASMLMLGLIRKLRHATKKIGSLALLDVYGRVANTLLQLAKEQDGQMVVDKLTHQEIANIVGASREMVTRIMHNLIECGYITLGNGKQIILNEKARAPF